MRLSTSHISHKGMKHLAGAGVAGDLGAFIIHILKGPGRMGVWEFSGVRGGFIQGRTKIQGFRPKDYEH